MEALIVVAVDPVQVRWGRARIDRLQPTFAGVRQNLGHHQPMRARIKACLTSTIAAASLAIPAAADSVRAVDGDTIILDGTTYRLWGVDAAETRQTCADGWQAGAEASRYLAELVAGRAVSCEFKDRDRYGRTVALCRADGQDLGAAMVRAGMAWAFVRYSGDYVGQERAAIGERTGCARLRGALGLASAHR